MSKREKNLLNVFLLLLLGGGLAVGAKYYVGKRKSLDTAYKMSVTELSEIEEITKERNRWEVRKTWMMAGLPKAISDEKMRLAMSELTTPAKNEPVEIKDREYPDPEADAHFQIAKVKFRAAGKLEDVMVWLQKRILKEKFLTIDYLQVRQSKADEEKADFLVILHKYYGH